MAEFVEKRCQDMIPVLEQMQRIKLFDESEIRSIAKKLKEYEYKIQRHTKCKEDYLRYIQYEMDLLKLIKQRRDVGSCVCIQTLSRYICINITYILPGLGSISLLVTKLG
ncbi:PREDICTED: U3 small nucleolar RNA-associated protein 6 homolog [Vollenhovia emeryi]|uniref:U3 small nucleolar RNA-associated protein 6 homolog n=1 Tax=Vollenhovia emeryi TaxID=411798 RepID=UPI0005F58208|nr:PREDICTED: U3 small nucleolar RNA-associated protein 6 homolog [Vollenhovia emeryi]